MSVFILINKSKSMSINLSIKVDPLRIKQIVQIFPDRCYGFDILDKIYATCISDHADTGFLKCEHINIPYQVTKCLENSIKRHNEACCVGG